MHQLSKEERVFVVENILKEKATQQFKLHLGNNLIMQHLPKIQSNKTLKNTIHMERA